METTMRTLTLAALATLTATFAAAPAFAHGYGHRSHGHSSYGHSSYGHSSYGHRHVSSYGYNSYQPTYHAPRYVAPAYVAPVYVAPKPTYETRPAYVYQKVQGHCTDAVVKHGYHTSRRTVECKAGPAPAPAAAPAPVEQAPAPQPEEAPK